VLAEGQRDIETFGRQKIDQLAELDRQDFSIPAGLLGDFVVGDHIGALLRLAEMAESNDRRMRHSFQPRRLKATMAGKNHIRLVDEQRIEKAELPDARRYLPDLLVGMCSRITPVGAKLSNRDPFDAGRARRVRAM
jgi:hypothetical protein